MPPRFTTPSLFAASGPDPSPNQDTSSKPSQKAAWIHAHCDGGARGNPGPSGYGALIEDDRGNILAELSEFLGLRTNNFAEYAGLLGCLQYALDHDHSRLKVVSDSELMVKQIQGKYQVKSPDLKPLYDEAKRRIARLQGFEIAHALRHKNKDADRLANEAMDRGMNRGTDRGMNRPGAQPAPSVKATVQPARSETPPIPISLPHRPAPAPQPAAAQPSAPPSPAPQSIPAGTVKADAMLRGFTRDGVIHILGGTALPDGVFVKIIRE